MQAWRLGAILFVSPDKGLALTAPRIKCDVPVGKDGGTDVYFQAQPVRLAATSDAGRHWVTSGVKLPGAPQSTAIEQVAAVDGARTWVVTDTGKLLVTGNAGAELVRAVAAAPGRRRRQLRRMALGAVLPAGHQQLVPPGRRADEAAGRAPVSGTT